MSFILLKAISLVLPLRAASADEASAQKAIGIIQELTATPELNKTYLGKVQRITDFGAFVEILPGKDGLVHRVLPGNFMGQNDGRIVSISSTKISLIEIVPDGVGGYIERPAALALTE